MSRAHSTGGTGVGKHRRQQEARRRYRARHAAPRDPALAIAGPATAALSIAAIAMTAAPASAAPAQAAPGGQGQGTAYSTAALDRPAAHFTAAARAAPATYTVRPGDSLSAISARLFGSAAKWPYLYDANLRAVGGNPNMIPVGLVLQRRLGSRAAYGQSAVATAYRAVTVSGGGDQAGCTPNCPWGDGDGDGMDLSHSPWQSAPAAQSSGSRSYSVARSYSGGGGYSGGTPGGSFGQCVVARESGGNSQVMNSTGHYGLYQFAAGTWAAYGGNPADFGHASVAEQEQVFANALAQGGQSNWSLYDGC